MKAMLLCAGYGTRLGTLTREVPKPMLPLAGRPLIAYLLGHLKSQGVREVAINLHFKPELLRGFLGDGSRWGLEVHYSLEAELSGTAGGLKRCEAFFAGEDAFLVQYGDILTDQDFGAWLRFHRDRQALATLLVHRRARSNSLVGLDPDGRITRFLERPSDAARRTLDSPWVSSSAFICSGEIFNHIPDRQPCDLPRDVFAPLVRSGRLHGFPLAGYRCAIDSPARLDAARRAIAEGHCRITPLRETE